MLTVHLPDGSSKGYPEETTLLEISAEFARGYSSPIVAATLNGEEKDLQNKILDGARIGFIELSSKAGMKVYSSSLVMVLYTAMFEALPGLPKLEVKSSFDNSVYCEISSQEPLPDNYIELLKLRMQEIINEKTPVIYQKISRVFIEKVLKQRGDYDRLGVIEQLDPEKGTISSYSCRGVGAYFFSPMTPHAGYLKVFDLMPYRKGLLLRYPDNRDCVMEPFKDQPKFADILDESDKWGEIIGCRTINSLNHIIKAGEIDSIIRVAEALHEKKIAQIADQIKEAGKHVKIILIAGPSGSGKTTFVQRLKIQLQVNGINPVPISIDDYFLERNHTPRKTNGDFDFESIHALDLVLFNDHLKRLLAGETVELPHFNFRSGSKEYRGHTLTLKPDQPLLIEGIHGLNDTLTSVIPSEEKIKIYISPLTQLRMDEHNLVSRTETRLLRRMVRDSRFRAHDALQTLKQWKYVLEGEEENIMPFQEKADIMFNTALIYELAVLKKHAEPLLKTVDSSHAEYTTAKRLLNLLDYVVSIDDETIPPNSLIREFVGNSWFY